MRHLFEDLDARELLKGAPMLSDAARERLPEILRDIVDADRALGAVRAQIAGPVVPFAAARAARNKLQARREMTASAEHLYGHRRGGGGTTRA